MCLVHVFIFFKKAEHMYDHHHHQQQQQHHSYIPPCDEDEILYIDSSFIYTTLSSDRTIVGNFFKILLCNVYIYMYVCMYVCVNFV